MKDSLEKIEQLLLGNSDDRNQAVELIAGILDNKEDLIEIFGLAFNLGCQVQRKYDCSHNSIESWGVMIEDQDGYDEYGASETPTLNGEILYEEPGAGCYRTFAIKYQEVLKLF